MNRSDSFRTFVCLLVLFGSTAVGGSKECISSGSITSKLFCYYSEATITSVDTCKCSHVVLPETTPVDQLQALTVEKGAKVLLTVKEFNENLIKTLNATKIFGLEIQLKKLDSKADIVDFISTARTKLGADLFIVLSVPARAEILAKFYDFKALSKHVDIFALQTHFLGANRNVTFHPSRLSGLWDVQNTDSVVDLVTGLGAPLSKLVITTPVQAFKFLLQDEQHTAPGSPALELSTMTRDELCATMENEEWTLERDQDQAGPYIFRKNKWISFEDAISMDIKAKYARVRGLAGLALKDLSQDGGAKCGDALLDSAFEGLTKQARAPRGAVLHSLEREILQTPVRPFDNVQVSPYRISRLIDTEGKVHVIRKDTRTEFQCSRQGYFVHPRSCNRFYRCVKFDQQSDEFSVFEFDCPAGLAFDERVEVCVWPGSLPNGAACAGSSEIAPVPRERFICPEVQGYYADPENCRWFFACLDHGKSPLTAYEFRCPYGLVFDQDRLLCEWSWLVPKCGSGGAVYEDFAYGFAAGAAGADGSGRVPLGLSLEGRDGDLDLYDGLGSLNHIKLGGLAGPLETTPAQSFSSFGHANGQYQGAGHNNLGEGENIEGAVIGNNIAYGNRNTVNIVAGGASGVGPYPSNVDISKHGLKIDVESITPATLLSSATISSIPIVSKVPIPSASNFETLGNFGVVANLPNLQYKLENPAIINHQLNGLINGYKFITNATSYGYGQSKLNGFYSGIPSGYSAYEAATYNHPQVLVDTYKYKRPAVVLGPQPLKPELMKTYTYGQEFSGYHYDRPSVAFEEGPIKPAVTYQQVHTQQPFYGYAAEKHVGYQYDKPAIKFEEKPRIPATTYQEVNLQSVGGVQEKHEGYVYNKPVVAFEEKPRKLPAVAYQNLQTEIQHSGYHYAKPAIKFEEKPAVTPALTYQQVALQPAVTYHEVKQPITYTKPQSTVHTYQEFNHQQGYQYNKPAIKFEEVPIVPTVATQQIKVQPAVAYQEVKQGYHYEKPAIKFEEKPSPPTIYQEVKVQPTIEVIHEVKNEGYHYEKPAVKFEEKPLPQVKTYQEVNIQPAVSYHQVNQEVKHEGYHYEKPTIKFEEKPVLPIVPVEEVKHTGYHYEKPAIKFEEKPVKTYQEVKVQPTVTYQQVQHEVQHGGYHYEKPAIKFEEKPVIPATTYQEIKVTPAVTYQQVHHEAKQYVYEKPKVTLVQKPVVPIVPATTYQEVHVAHEVKQEGYHYDKPAIAFEEKPIIPATVYHETKHETKPIVPIVQPTVAYQEVKHVPIQTYQEVKVQPAVTYQEIKQNVKPQGYYYEKPKIVFEEKPQQTYVPITQEVKVQPAVTYSEVKHAVKQEVQNVQPIIPATTYQEVKVQPAVTYQQVNHEVKHEGYHYEKPKIIFEEKPQQTYLPVATPTHPPPPPAVTYQEVKVQPAVTYQEVKHEGYHYDKPKVVFEEKPQQVYLPAAKPKYLPPPSPTYQEVNVQKPTVTYLPQPQQPVIHSYSYQHPVVDQNIQTQSYHEIKHHPVAYQEVKVKPTVYQEVKHEGYHYAKPTIKFEEKPYVPEVKVQPQQPVITYHQQGYHYEKPKVIFEEHPVTPATTYIHKPQPTPLVTTYHEVKPFIVEQKPTYKQVVQAVTPKPTIVNTFSIQQYGQGYKYERPAVTFEEKPHVTYLPAKPAYVRPKLNPALQYIPPKPVAPAKAYLPQVVQKYEPVKVKPVQTYYQEYYNAKEVVEQPAVKTTAYKTGYYYNKPAIKFEEYTTPKPTYQSTVANILKVEPAPLQFYSYDSRLHAKVTPKVVNPTVAEVPLVPVVPLTTSKPIVRYEFSAVPVAPVQPKQFLISVPDREYLPVTTTRRPVIITTRKQYLPPSTPKRVYLPVTTTERYVEVTTPSREYLPVTQEILKIRTSTPAQEYLPVTKKVRTRPTTTTTTTTTEKPSREYLPATSTPPSREYLPVKSTTAKPNREYLPAKQIENYEYNPETPITITSRRPKVIKVVRTRPIVKVNDFHPILAAKLGAQCTCTSNTLTLRRRKPQKALSDDDGTTRISDLEEYVPNADQLDLQYNSPKKESVIIVAEDEDDINQDEEVRKQDIAKAVNSGLKLVKSAVKQGVKEGVQEALAGKDFDRYGPGGVRGRSETLQGTIDCQRAGLFRHPKHCNKFYACRWDETKKKFTLHVFNCPVHLTFDNNLGACNWPSQGPACVDNTLLPSD